MHAGCNHSSRSAADQAPRAYGDQRLGELIRQARKARRASRLDLARAAGVSEQLIGAIERGERSASPDVRAAIAGHLEISLPGSDRFAEAVRCLADAFEAAATPS